MDLLMRCPWARVEELMKTGMNVPEARKLFMDAAYDLSKCTSTVDDYTYFTQRLERAAADRCVPSSIPRFAGKKSRIGRVSEVTKCSQSIRDSVKRRASKRTQVYKSF